MLRKVARQQLLGKQSKTSDRPVAIGPIEYEHEIVARTCWTAWPTRWDVELLHGSSLRQDFLADPRAAHFRRQRDVLMLPGDQHGSFARQRRRHHLGIVVLAVTGIYGQA